jgi:mycofactocin precursor
MALLTDPAAAVSAAMSQDSTEFAVASDDGEEEPEILGDVLIDELSIDGMCGVY